MLQIRIDGREFFDETTNTFREVKPITLVLEHSLLSISKWESKWHKPFFVGNAKDQRSSIEMEDYIRCMTLNKNVPDEVYKMLSPADISKITNYVNDPMTATTVNTYGQNSINREVITSELIYYWMVSFNIPFECEKWHINRLLTLIKVCNAKNNPKKMSKRDIYSHNRELNRARRKALGTKG